VRSVHDAAFTSARIAVTSSGSSTW
jgi:hypothetical protein